MLGKYYSMMKRLIKCERVMHTMQLKMIVQIASPLRKISPDTTTQFQLDNVSDSLAKMNETTKITANAYPIQALRDLDVNMTLKLKTRIMLNKLTNEIMPKSETYPC